MQRSALRACYLLNCSGVREVGVSPTRCRHCEQGVRSWSCRWSDFGLEGKGCALICESGDRPEHTYPLTPHVAWGGSFYRVFLSSRTRISASGFCCHRFYRCRQFACTGQNSCPSGCGVPETRSRHYVFYWRCLDVRHGPQMGSKNPSVGAAGRFLCCRDGSSSNKECHDWLCPGGSGR